MSIFNFLASLSFLTKTVLHAALDSFLIGCFSLTVAALLSVYVALQDRPIPLFLYTLFLIFLLNLLIRLRFFYDDQ
jgi:nucleoside recognition membrane protein YjiH